MNHNKNKIVFDRTAFIPDRYFSRKAASILHLKDMYRDKGRVLPLIAPVRHHMEIAEVKNQLRIQNASKSLVKDRKLSRSFLRKNNSKESLEETSKTVGQQSLYQTLDSTNLEDENKSVEEENPEEEDEEEDNDNDDDDDVLSKELNKSIDTAEKKRKPRMEDSLDQFISIENEDENRQDFSPEPGKPSKHRKLTPLEKVEESKEILRKLETPFEIYNRFSDLTKVRGRNASDTNIDPNRLQDILKKLDLVVDINTTAASNGRTGQALKELKKVPLQYFHMYRKKHERYLAKHPKVSRNAIFVDHRDSSSYSSQIVLNYQDSSSDLHNLTFDAVNNNTTLGDEIISRINPRDSAKPLAVIQDFKRQMSVNWDVDISELTQNFNQTFFSPLHRCVESLEKDPSTLNIFPEGQTRPLPAHKQGWKRGPGGVTFKQERSKSESKKGEKIGYLKNKVRGLDYNIANFRRVNTQNIAIVKSFNKSLKEDVEVFRSKKLGGMSVSTEKEIDQYHYEDAIHAQKAKLSEMNYNRGFSQVHLSNKKERNVENVKFEKHIAKVEKKILERAKVKLSIITALKSSVSRVKTEGAL